MNLHIHEMVLQLELRICSFVSEHNLPLSLANDLVELLKKRVPKDEVLKNIKMNKQKTLNFKRYGKQRKLFWSFYILY